MPIPFVRRMSCRLALMSVALAGCSLNPTAAFEHKVSTVQRIQLTDDLRIAVAKAENVPKAGLMSISICALDQSLKRQASAYFMRLIDAKGAPYLTVQIPSADYQGDNRGRIDVQVRREEFVSLRLRVMYEAADKSRDEKAQTLFFDIDLSQQGEKLPHPHLHTVGLECKELLP
jgi:hypothetical protein